jgi:hypothetical protein
MKPMNFVVNANDTLPCKSVIGRHVAHYCNHHMTMPHIEAIVVAAPFLTDMTLDFVCAHDQLIHPLSILTHLKSLDLCFYADA